MRAQSLISFNWPANRHTIHYQINRMCFITRQHNTLFEFFKFPINTHFSKTLIIQIIKHLMIFPFSSAYNWSKDGDSIRTRKPPRPPPPQGGSKFFFLPLGKGGVGEVYEAARAPHLPSPPLSFSQSACRKQYNAAGLRAQTAR